MKRPQYKKSINPALASETNKGKHNIELVRSILHKLNVPFPKGNVRDTLHILMSGKYMAWKPCSKNQAHDYANRGFATVGFIKDKVVVVIESDNVIKNSVRLTDSKKPSVLPMERLSQSVLAKMRFFSFMVPLSQCDGFKTANSPLSTKPSNLRSSSNNIEYNSTVPDNVSSIGKPVTVNVASVEAPSTDSVDISSTASMEAASACTVCDVYQYCTSCDYYCDSCNSCNYCETCQGCETICDYFCDGCDYCDACQDCNYYCEYVCQGCDYGDSCMECDSCDSSCLVSCQSCNTCNSCDTCESCDYCDYCDSCQYCDYYCEYCNYCDSCNYCESVCESSCQSCNYCDYCQSEQVTIPGIPSLSSSNITTNSFTVSWPAVSGATSYTYSFNDEYVNIGNTLFKTFTGLSPGTSYTVAVRAHNSAGYGQWAYIDVTTLTGKRYISPYEDSKPVFTSMLGYREVGNTKLHTGLDMAISDPNYDKSIKLVSIADGKVIKNRNGTSGNGGAYGYQLIVEYNDPVIGRFRAVYAHMKSESPLKENDLVKQGDLIGYQGGSYNPTNLTYYASHLHFSTWKLDNSTDNDIDAYLSTGNQRKLFNPLTELYGLQMTWASVSGSDFFSSLGNFPGEIAVLKDLKIKGSDAGYDTKFLAQQRLLLAGIY